MTAYEDLRDDAAPGGGDDEERRRPTLLGNIGRGLTILVVASSFLVWVYAYSGAAERDAPDRLADETWGDRAEMICAEAVEDIEAMPGALDAVDGPDRARQVEATNVRYEAMLEELDALSVADNDPRDVEISTGWIADWRVLIEDRYTYAEGIAVDDQTQFFITDTGVAERLDRRVTRLANTNDMPSCAAPTDLG
ncbi:MAG: hypothetical protein AAF962_24700 [Actinomycetota bacterium]